MLRALRGAGCSVLRVSHVRFFMLAQSKRKRGFLYEKYSFVSMPSGGATQISIQILRLRFDPAKVIKLALDTLYCGTTHL